MLIQELPLFAHVRSRRMEAAQQATFNFWALSLRILHTSPPLLRLPIYITGNLLLIFFPPSRGNYQGVAFQCCPGAVSFSNIALFHTKIKPWLLTSGKSNGQMGRILGVTTGMDKLLTSYTNRMLHFTKYRSRQKATPRQWLYVRLRCDLRQKHIFFCWPSQTNSAPNSASVQSVRYSFMG